MIFLLNGVIQTTVVLIAALLAVYLLRGNSAAFRHCVLSAGILFAAVVPGLSLMMPSWNYVLPIHSAAPLQPEVSSIPTENPVDDLAVTPQDFPSVVSHPVIRTAATPNENPKQATSMEPAPSAKTSTTSGGSSDSRIPGGSALSTSEVASWIWIAGLLLTFTSLTAGVARLCWIAIHSRVSVSEEWTRTAREIASHYGLTRPPRLLISGSSILVTWGWRSPRILLPPGSESWPIDRIRAVLCHELAHVRRGDWLIQMTAELLRGIYWFNPVMWVVCRTLRSESEQASDDAALRCGISDTDYAEHLLDVVRSLRQPRRTWSYALSMAHPSTLEKRFKAILNPALNRRELTRLSVIAILAAFLIVTIPISMLRGSASRATPLMNAMRSIASVVTATPTIEARPEPVEQSTVPPTVSQSDSGILQGTVQRSDQTQPISEAQITLEGGPPDPKSIQALIQAVSTRGVIFNPKRTATVDDVLRDVADQAGAQGQGPGFPVFDEAVAAFRATNAARYVAESDTNGRFIIRDVPAGDYIVHVDREGFFDLAARAGNPIKVRVQAAQSVNAALSMIAGGVVSGHVRDVSGDPQQNVGVQMFALAYQNGFPILRGTIQKLTDDRGAYRLFWLAPGEYYIGVNPGGNSNADATQRTMYPGTLDISKATPVSVRAGEQVTGVDIQLPTDVLPKISGKVTSTIPAEETAQQASLYNAALARPTLMLIGRDPSKPDIGAGTARTIGTVTLTGGTGTFEVPGILPGAYDLYLRIPQSNAQGGAGFSFAKVPIDVGNENVTGISITVNHVVNVTGSITIDGKQPGSTPIRLHFQPDGSGVKLGAYQSVGQRVITPDENGGFTSLGVPPGLFRMDVEPGLPGDVYLADVRQGGTSVFDTGITITSEKPNPLQVVFNSGGGAIEGTALDASGKPMANASVVLAPLMMRRQNRALYHTATADANGKFTLKNLAPGAYQLFAWQQSIPAGAYFNAGFLARYEDRSRTINVVGKSTTTEQITAVPLQ